MAKALPMFRRYINGEPFTKPTVLHTPEGWLVVGPGWPWLGVRYPRHREALDAALAGPYSYPTHQPHTHTPQN